MTDEEKKRKFMDSVGEGRDKYETLRMVERIVQQMDDSALCHPDDVHSAPDSNVRDDVDTQSQPSLITIKTAVDWCAEASSRPDPRPLWRSMWYEGEVCCLFADSNLGKSIYAVQIAQEVALTERVIYFDFELSDKQFQLRYTDENRSIHRFPDNFLRAEINPESFFEDVGNLEDSIIREIENAAVKYQTTKIIIDNLSFLCNASDKSDMAGRLMLRLLDLKRRLGLSVLVLAHTPKRALSSPITQNDLAGSKKLFNFFDSVFAIGRSAKDPDLRYIKQLKVRAGAFEYGADNVIICEITKNQAWLHFSQLGFATEREHLREEKDGDDGQILCQVQTLKDEGLTIREIATRLKLSQSKVFRVIKKNKEK